MRRSRSLWETTKKGRTSLLVSVRNVAEARAAYEGGAAVIDIKEPRAGALGAASGSTIAEIVAFIDGRRPVTAALGELAEIDKSPSPVFGGGHLLREGGGGGLPADGFFTPPLAPPLPGEGDFRRVACLSDVTAVKVGFAGLGETDWPGKLAHFSQQVPPSTELVPAAYADWQAAGAPNPWAVMEVAAKQGLSWLLLDTWDKSSGDLLDHCTEPDLISLLAKAKQHGLQMVLAGRLQGESLRKVCQLGPDLVGVRSAVCAGGRDGQVSASLVTATVKAVELAAQSILGQDQPP